MYAPCAANSAPFVRECNGMKRIIRVRVPATTANIGPGFYCFGAALALYCRVDATVEIAKKFDLSIAVSGEGAGMIPRDTRNIVWKAMEAVFHAFRVPANKIPALALSIHNDIPIASGLGSSAAARVAGCVLAYRILKKPLDTGKINQIASALEGHPDNVVPALVGGWCVSVTNGATIEHIKLPVPHLKTIVCTPDFSLNTERARRALPKKVLLRDAVFNLSRSAMMIAALAQKQYQMLSCAMKDRLHQPYRQKLIPGMESVLNAARMSGAVGAALSGAGPSLIALASTKNASRVARAMQTTWKRHMIVAQSRVLSFDTTGTSVQEHIRKGL